MTNKVFIPLLLAFLVVVSSATLLATKTWDPAWNPFKTASSDKIIENAIAKIANAKTFSYEGVLIMDIDQSGEKSKATFNLKGTLDNSQADNIKTANTINLSVGQGDETAVTAGLDLNLISKSLYLRINSIPTALNIPLISGDFLQSLQGKWIGITEEEIKQLAGVDTTTTDQEEAEETAKLLLADLKKLSEGKNIFKTKQQLADVEIDGENTSHYVVDINKEAIKEMIPEYYALMEKYGLTDQTDEEYQAQIKQAIQDAPEAIDNAWDKIGGISFEAWINNKGELKMISFEKTIDSSELGTLDPTETPMKATISATLTFSDINKPANITIPTDAMTIEELFMSLGLFSNLTLPETTPTE